jgi:ATP-binding cassette, subfamily B, bacterial
VEKGPATVSEQEPGVPDQAGPARVGASAAPTEPGQSTGPGRVGLVPWLAAWLLSKLTASATARRAVVFFADQGRRLIVIVLLNLAGAVSLAATPFVARRIVDHGLTSPGVVSFLPQLAIVLVVFLFDAAVTSIATVVGANLGETVTLRATTMIHDQLLRLPFSFFPGQRQGEILSLFGGDVSELNGAVSRSLPRAASAAVTACVGLVTVFVLDWRLTLAALVLAPGVGILNGLGRRSGRKLTRRHIWLRSRMFAQVSDTTNVSGALHVRLFGQSDFESRRLDGTARAIRRVAVQRTVVVARASLLASVGAALAVVMVTGFGLWLVSTGRASVGTLIAFAGALLLAYRPVIGIAESRSDLLDAGVAVDRIFGLLDVPVDPRDLPTVTSGAGRPPADGHGAVPALLALPAPRSAPPSDGARGVGRPGAPEIVVEDVWFQYPTGVGNDWSAAGRDVARRWWYVDADAELDENAAAGAPAGRPDTAPPRPAAEAGPPARPAWNLAGLDLIARAGEKTAIVGTSGAGKTTLGYLLAGIYQADRGHIRCGGVDLAAMPWTALRAMIGVVPQEPHLFHDTIAANVRYGRLDATDDEVRAAVHAAGLTPLVEKLPNGMATTVGARGYQLSGGERQRMALARVLLADPPVLVLDEATSQLDAETERVVQESLARLAAGRTQIVIAHRLSTIVDASVIHVMDHGRVVERGTHAELLEHGGTYAELYSRQLSGLAEPTLEETGFDEPGFDEPELQEAERAAAGFPEPALDDDVTPR